MITLGAPLGLLGLLALAAVVGLHLYRRRLTRRPTAGLFLYAAAAQAPTAGRRRAPLRRRASLLFELLAALALVWALTDPFLATPTTAEHLVVVLDDRACLHALRADGRSVRDALGADLDARLADLAPDDRVTLVQSGRAPRVLLGPEATPTAARAALLAWDPRAPDHAPDRPFAAALGLARDLAPGAAVLIASDRVPERLPPGVGVVARGDARPTSGLADARWLRADGRHPERVTARVVAWSALPITRELTLSAQGRVVARERLTLPPGQPVGVVLPLPEEAPLSSKDPGISLALTLNGPDPLALDDAVTLIRPPSREVTVALDVADPGPWQRALTAVGGARLVASADRGVHLRVVGPAAAARPGPTGAAAGTEPPWSVRVAPAVDGPAALGPFLAARGHPLLRGVDLTGAIWVGGVPTASATGSPLLLAGDRVLIAEADPSGPTGGALTLHLDLARAPLVDHPAWPALVANLVAARRAALPGPSRTNAPLGQPVVVTLPAGVSRLAVVDPTGVRVERVADGAGQVLIPGLERVGLHRLELLGDDGQPIAGGERREGAEASGQAWGQVNGILVDPTLGDLSAARTADVTPALGQGATVSRRRSAAERLAPLLLALAALLLAWRAFGREERGASASAGRSEAAANATEGGRG